MSRESFPLSAELYFRVRERALAFARSHDSNSTAEVLKVSPASNEEIKKFGTPGTVVYAQVVVRMQPTAVAVKAAMEEALSKPDAYGVEDLQRFLESPLDLRIVCSAANVIHHELLGCCICCGEDASFEVPVNAPVVPNAGDATICNRAIAFALSHEKYASADVLQVGPASNAVIEKYGTSRSAGYLEVVLCLEYSATYRASMLAMEAMQRNPSLESMRDFLASPRGLKVTCSASDVIHHQWLRLVRSQTAP